MSKKRKKKKKSNVIKAHRKLVDKVIRDTGAKVEDLISRYAKWMQPEEIPERIKILDVMFPDSDAFYEQWVQVDDVTVGKVRAISQGQGRVRVEVDLCNVTPESIFSPVSSEKS